ncbi:hypothetical protein KGA65_14705 [Ideonella sp. B7]|uniref:hypothetical protein n=1 Tax=Ideonella benzenivorans TaxID=2831643 RepID=UPI001CEC2D42|nr:hypothetical protein [Ideonella benzenivorans]MCA6217783.1 hypothetical protein [Ideonella benzenivorans]
MRGHQALIQMRLRGLVPLYGVEIETDARGSGWPEQWPQLHAEYGVHSPQAYVHIEPEDRLALLDLRWVHGLEARVEGIDPQRVNAVVEALALAGALRAIGIVYVPRPGGETDSIEIIDSKGVMSWRK